MELDELKAFLAVVQTGSFVRAAEHLGWPRSTLRRKVDALETRAGIPLLQRTPLGVAATDAGALLAQRGQSMVQEASALLAAIRDSGGEPTGVLRAVLPVGLPPQAFAPMFSLLRQACPKLAFDVRHRADPLAERITDFDVAVHFGGAPDAQAFISHVVLPMSQRLIASADYLARTGAPKNSKELLSRVLLCWQAPNEDARVLHVREGGTLRATPTLVSSDIHALRQCCLAGDGITYAPDALLADSDDVVAVLPRSIGRNVELRFTVPIALAEIPKVRTVLAYVRNFISTMAHAKPSPDTASEM